MLRLPALLVAVLVIVGSGVVHGLWTDRWAVSSEPAASAAKLAGVPTTVGDWVMVEERSLSAKEQATGGITGYVIRRYIHRQTRNQVEMYLLCGRPGHISVHTPDICFQGAGYQFNASPERNTDLGQPGNDFWVAQCSKNTTALSERVRIFWSWNATGQWQAPNNPRLHFARSKALFKLYVIHPLPANSEPVDKDPSLEFMSQMLPVLKRCLFPDT
jgi:hypothetical protein